MVNEAKLNKYYSAIAEKMDEMIPCEWERIVLRAEESGSVSSAGFYFYTNNNEVHWSDGIPELYKINEREFRTKRRELFGIIKELWQEFNNAGEQAWHVFVFKLDSERKFSAKFDYEINSDIETLERRIRWAYDELGIIPQGEYGRKLLKEYLEAQRREIPVQLQDK